MKALISATLLLIYSALAHSAGGDCSCRAKNVVAYEGEVVCLSTPNGPRLAVCEKVLNNTSWKFLPQNCPPEKYTEQKQTDDERPALLVITHPDIYLNVLIPLYSQTQP